MKIMFVCTGNTCRSAMAEGLAKKIIKEKNLAGVVSWQKDMEDDAVWSMLKNELK